MDKQRKLQKFSIRKYTVGTCSILIGTLIFLGLPTHDAFASENVIQKHAQEEKAEDNSTDPVDEASAIEESSNVEGTKEIGTAETPAEQPKEEAITEAPTVDETTQDTTTNEETTTEDKSTTETASTEEATQVDTVAPEAAKVETVEKAEQPKAESIEVAKEETSIEETAETTAPTSNTEDVVQPSSVEETPAVDTPTVEATVTNTISDVDANSVSSKSLEDIVNNQNKDKVEATTLEQPSRQAPRTGENYSSVFRAAVLQTRNVSNYNQLLAALNDRNVGKIVFNNDITMPNPTKNIFGVKNDSQKLNLNAARAVTIDLNKHLFDTAKNYFEMDTNGKNQPGWNITFSNGHINTQDNRPGSGRRPRGLIQYGSNSHDQIINFRDISHTGVTLVNDENLKVNISGEFTSHQTGKLGANENLTIAANEIRISNGSTINMTMTGEGKVFKLYTTREVNERDKLKGILAFGDNTKVNIEAYDPKFYDYGNNSQDIFYVEGKGSRITFGDNNKITLKGQDIFNFDSEYAMVSFGENNTVNVDQRGNGQIINMHDNSDFELGRGTQFLATSNGKINQGRPSPRDNTLVRFKAISRLIIKEDATFKLDAINHLRNANTGKVHSHNALFVMEGWRGAASEIILKNNATFDLRTDNTDFDHSEVLVLPNLSSNDTSLKIEGTAKYVNIQRTATTRHPNKNTAMIYGDGKAIITWKGDHRVMTWNTNHLSDKNKTYENLVNGDTSNPDHVWNNINNFTARLYNHELTVESLSDPKNPDASSRNTPLSNIDRNTSNHKNISSMNAGDITRFVLIGHDVELTSIEERNTVFTAIQDESKQKGEHNITQEGRDGLRTKYTTRLKNNEGNGYVTSSYIRDKNGNPITPIEKHVDVNTLEVTEEDIEFKTIYEADTIKLTTEPNETIQEAINGKKKVSTVYKLNEETGELIETVETAEDGTQTNPVVTEETLLEKQDKIIKVGAKEVTTEDIQPTVEYEDDPNLPSGIEEVADEGIPGKKTVTTIYNIDPETGNRTTVANTNEEISKEPTRKIVKRGIGTNADLNTPGYSDTPRETKPGKAVDVPQNDDTELPAGTKFSIPSDRVPAGWTATINPDNGNVTATPPADAASGTTADIPVEVTYPDGTKDTATAKVTVVPNEAQGNNPNYGNEPVPTKPGVAKNVPQTGDNTLPPGTTYEIPDGAKIPDGWTATVDPNTGVVTVTPPDYSSNGDSANIPVKVKYPDGSSDDTTVPIKVVTNQAEDHTPGYEDQTTIPGKTLEVSQSGDKKLPSGTKFEIPEDSVPDGWIATVDPITGVATVTPPANSNGDESERITVLVKYPDGTSEETEFIVELSIPNSTAYQPTYGKEPIPVKRGTATEVSLKDNDAPKGSVFEIDEKSVPNGWTATINPETGAITVTSPTNIPSGTVQDFGVLVKYPDSTSELIPVKVIVDDSNNSSDDNGGSDANPDSNNGSDSAADSNSDSNSNSGSDMNSDSNNDSGSNIDSSSDSDANNSGSNTDSSSDSQSDKDSNSANDSNSDSNSNSGSDMNSDSNNNSGSDANPDSNNGSDSAADSNSANDSSSDSEANGGSDSSSTSDANSNSDSDSNSNSGSDTSSDANNNSNSNTDSSSENHSNKDSNSANDSSSDSNDNTGSDANPDSNNGSSSATDSNSDSNTNSGSDSQSDKDSNSDTDSNSATDSSSDSNNDSGSNTDSSSDSQSDKDSNSANDSSSDSDSNSNSGSDMNSDSNNNSGSNTDSGSDSNSNSGSDSDANNSGSNTDSSSDSNSNSGSDLATDSSSDSNSTSGDNSTSNSDSNSNSGSDMNSDSNNNSGSNTDSSSDSDANNSGSNTDSSSDSQSDKDSNSANDSSSDSDSNSNSGSDMNSDSNNDSGSNTDSSSDSQSDKDSNSANDSSTDSNTNNGSDTATDSSSDSNSTSGDNSTSNSDSNSNNGSDMNSDSHNDSSSNTDSSSDSNSTSDDNSSSDSDSNSGSTSDSNTDSSSDSNSTSNSSSDSDSDKDTDGDGIADKDDTDIDGDGVSNEDEKLIGTDPNNPDTDGNGVSDGDEDHDSDGVPNKDESDHKSDTPTDKDGDGKPDISTPKDTDGDGITDKDDNDIDGDGVSNEDEKLIGTDPNNPDTDGNGVSDGDEDHDSDGIPNKDESDPSSDQPTDKD
ncbi:MULTISPECIES: YPDG domain-containing protein, partial [unclassified Mammaliicoccus]|uniref:YPDG domain-containing protein n=1 Tax=unclassified Mammaliicoccus TaxID=2803851 RepID=UPI001EFB1222